MHQSFVTTERGGLVVEPRTPEREPRGRGFDTYLRLVVSLSKDIYSPKSIGNTQEVVAPSQHD